jgi:hypothetical protein
MKAEGKTFQGAAVRSASASGRTLKIVLLALLGLTAGQAVVWYTGQFYALFFLQQHRCKVDGAHGQRADRRGR